MNSIQIKYKSSVLVEAGWREVEITAEAEAISTKRAKVTNVLAIDGKPISGYASRTGAKRQTYNSRSIAAREVDKIKNISSCKMEIEQ